MMFAPRLNQRVGRNLDAEVDHAIAVVGENDLDQILADVVDVALHRSQHDLAARRGVGLLHELFQMIDGSLHGFGRLQNFGHDQLIQVEQAADFGHACHQWSVDDVERVRAFLPLQLQVGDQTVLGAFDDVARQALVERQFRDHLPGLMAGAPEIFADRGNVELIDGDFLLAGLLAPVGRSRNARGRRVEEQVIRQAPLFVGERCVALQSFRVDDGQVQPGFRRVVQKY